MESGLHVWNEPLWRFNEMMKQQRRIIQAYYDIARLQYAPLIQKLAFRIGINPTQVEELKLQGVKELLRCMICYKRSGSFMTFFHGRLTGIFKHMRDAEKRAGRVRIMPIDSMLNIAGPDCDMDAHMMVQECLECLNERERNIIIELFFNKKTMRQISNDRGDVVPSTICRIKATAINKMKQKCKIGVE